LGSLLSQLGPILHQQQPPFLSPSQEPHGLVVIGNVHPNLFKNWNLKKSKSRNGWKNTAQVLAILRRGPSNNEARRWSKANTTDCDNQRDNKIGAQEQSSDLDSN